MSPNKEKTILVVDDDKELCEILVDQLTRAGFKTLSAHDGEEGLKVALEHKPNLILLDVMMPKMDGIKMLEKLREHEWGKKVPVVLLTVMDQPEVLSRAVELGGYEYFVKTDWKIEEIVERVKQKLAAQF